MNTKPEGVYAEHNAGHDLLIGHAPVGWLVASVKAILTAIHSAREARLGSYIIFNPPEPELLELEGDLEIE